MLSKLTHIARTVQHVLRDQITGGKRSPHWPAVEHAHLKLNPTCAACGGTEKLQVHHCAPFHQHPELELDPTNLVTLCMAEGKHDHLLIGHGGNFRSANLEVRVDAAKCLAIYNSGADPKTRSILLEQVAEDAKAKRKDAP